MSGVKLLFMLDFREIRVKSNNSKTGRLGGWVPIRFLISVVFSIDWLFHFFDSIQNIDFREIRVKSNNSKTGRLEG